MAAAKHDLAVLIAAEMERQDPGSLLSPEEYGDLSHVVITGDFNLELMALNIRRAQAGVDPSDG